MSLKHGLLGLLGYGNMTGYELNQTFEQSLGFFGKHKWVRFIENSKHLLHIDRDIQDIFIYIIFVITLSLGLLLLHFEFTKVGDYDVSFTQYAPMLGLVLLLLVRNRVNQNDQLSKWNSILVWSRLFIAWLS